MKIRYHVCKRVTRFVRGSMWEPIEPPKSGRHCDRFGEVVDQSHVCTINGSTMEEMNAAWWKLFEGYVEV